MLILKQFIEKTNSNQIELQYLKPIKFNLNNLIIVEYIVIVFGFTHKKRFQIINLKWSKTCI